MGELAATWPARTIRAEHSAGMVPGTGLVESVKRISRCALEHPGTEGGSEAHGRTELARRWKRPTAQRQTCRWNNALKPTKRRDHGGV